MNERHGDDGTVNPRQIFVLSGPSGVGKNTIARRLCCQGLAVRGITATTRPPKPGETDGEDYRFVTEDEFLRWMREGRLVEHARYVGHYYGTPAFALKEAARSGLPVLLTIEVEGGLQVKRRWPEATLVFVEPPSMKELERRLIERGRDGAEAIKRRIERARQELEYAPRYDFRIVNDELDAAVAEVARIISERYRPEKPQSQR